MLFTTNQIKIQKDDIFLDNKVTILSNGAEEGSTIDSTAAQAELEKVTLLVDQAETKKEKIEATLELRKAKARLQAVA